MKFGNDMITFEEAVAYLKDMPRFTVKKNPADNRDLKWFLKKLGNPEQNLRIIHVAGTNGKGSVCAYMSSILQEAGYRTAVFTSPHLVDMRERFTVNGKMISEEAFLQVYRAVGDALQEANSVNTGVLLPGGEAAPEFVLNFYEYLFCMALLCFAEEKPDYCIIETGLGGRLDATNYVDNKLLTVITRISLDHVQYLGDTTAKIAAEKAGILRPGVPVVYLDGDADASAVICCKASELGAPQIPVSKKDYTFLGFRKKYIDFSLRSEYYNYISLTLHTIARYQMENAALAVRAVEVLFRSTDTEENGGRLCAGAGCPTVEEIRRGILGCFWQGRMEEVLSEVYVDGAHNDDGIRAFLDTVEQDGCTGGRRLLFGVAADKDCRHMIQRVITSGLFDHIAFTHMRTERSLSMEEFRDLLAAYPGHYTMYTEADTALREQLGEKRPGERLYIAGSLYLVGEIKESLDHDQF
uniref:bifunctional folylpolyglutamate synthase/dihydrofolate synthase n=1 Tax=Acetatifactor sp. TaxID=1872090 RepID=UPI004028D49F